MIISVSLSTVFFLVVATVAILIYILAWNEEHKQNFRRLFFRFVSNIIQCINYTDLSSIRIAQEPTNTYLYTSIPINLINCINYLPVFIFIILIYFLAFIPCIE